MHLARGIGPTLWRYKWSSYGTVQATEVDTFSRLDTDFCSYGGLNMNLLFVCYISAQYNDSQDGSAAVDAWEWMLAQLICGKLFNYSLSHRKQLFISLNKGDFFFFLPSDFPHLS